MARRPHIPITMSNSVLKGSEGETSKFTELGEKGVAIYFLLLKGMNLDNRIWTTANMILSQLNLQRRDKSQIIKSINFLIDEKLIIGNKITKETKSNDVLNFIIRSDFKEQEGTVFQPTDFDFCKILGIKGFSLFCIIDSVVRAKGKGHLSIKDMQTITKFSNSTITKYIHVMEKLGIYEVEKHETKTESNLYKVNNTKRKEILERDIEEVKTEVANIIEQKENL